MLEHNFFGKYQLGKSNDPYAFVITDASKRLAYFSGWIPGSNTLIGFTNDGPTTILLGPGLTLSPTNVLSASGAGDNWGTQVVNHDATLTGDGASTPLGIASNGATTGQTLVWDGTAWTPMTIVGSDNWGTQIVMHDVTLDGAGTTTSPLTIAQQAAVAGQLLAWNGTTWAPTAPFALTDGSGTTLTSPTQVDWNGTITSPVVIDGTNTQSITYKDLSMQLTAVGLATDANNYREQLTKTSSGSTFRQTNTTFGTESILWLNPNSETVLSSYNTANDTATIIVTENSGAPIARMGVSLANVAITQITTDTTGIYMQGLNNSTTTSILYYDPTTFEVYYGAAPSGAGTLTAANDVRIDTGVILRGSNSKSLPLGSQFTYTTYNHLNSFNDAWLGTDFAGTVAVTINNDNNVIFGYEADDLTVNPATAITGFYWHYANASLAVGTHVRANITSLSPSSYMFGINHAIFGEGSAIVGGYNNTIDSDSSFVAAGNEHIITATNSFIGAGYQNTAAGGYSAITGSFNTTAGLYSVADGYYNLSPSYASIAGGVGNVTFTNQDPSNWISLDVIESMGNSNMPSATQSNFRTTLKNGSVQFRNNNGVATIESQATPKAALEVVSLTQGILPTRFNNAQATARLTYITSNPSNEEGYTDPSFVANNRPTSDVDDREGEFWYNYEVRSNQRVVWDSISAALIIQNY